MKKSSWSLKVAEREGWSREEDPFTGRAAHFLEIGGERVCYLEDPEQFHEQWWEWRVAELTDEHIGNEGNRLYS